MEVRFTSADHTSKQPNYRLRWYNTANAVVHESLFAFQQVGVVTPETTPPTYRLTNVPKPAPPHTSDYRVTLAAESTTGVSAESAFSDPFSLSPPAAPANVVVINPLV